MLKRTAYLDWCLAKMRNQDRGRFSKELVTLYQSLPMYYACMAVKGVAGMTDLAGKKAEAAKCYGDLAVAGWMKFLREDCEHPLPAWLTYSLMGRTSKDGEFEHMLVLIAARQTMLAFECATAAGRLGSETLEGGDPVMLLFAHIVNLPWLWYCCCTRLLLLLL